VSGAGGVRLTWYTKTNCGLCDEAWPHLRRAATVLRLDVTQVDIATDPALEARFGTQVPVLAHQDEVLAEGAMTRWDVWRSVLSVRFRR
jgi:hypothetical protein